LHLRLAEECADLPDLVLATQEGCRLAGQVGGMRLQRRKGWELIDQIRMQELEDPFCF
jgi:hypothetical protein